MVTFCHLETHTYGIVFDEILREVSTGVGMYIVLLVSKKLSLTGSIFFSHDTTLESNLIYKSLPNCLTDSFQIWKLSLT